MPDDEPWDDEQRRVSLHLESHKLPLHIREREALRRQAGVEAAGGRWWRLSRDPEARVRHIQVLGVLILLLTVGAEISYFVPRWLDAEPGGQYVSFAALGIAVMCALIGAFSLLGYYGYKRDQRKTRREIQLWREYRDELIVRHQDVVRDVRATLPREQLDLGDDDRRSP